MMKPVWNFFSNLALVVTLAVTTLLLAEYAVRWLIPYSDPEARLTYPHIRPDLPKSGVPNTEVRMINVREFDVTVRFNRHGLRDERDVTEARADEFIFIGDSQTFGQGVQARERFSERVGYKLGVGTYNVAVPTDIRGYKQLLEFAKENGARAQHLVVGLSMETDILPYPFPGQFDSANDTPADRQVGRGLRFRLLPLKKWLKDHSSLYFVVTSLVHQSPVLRDLAGDAGLIIPAQGGAGVPKNAWDPQVIEQTVAALQDLCSGYDCTIAIIPSRALRVGDNQQTEARVHEAVVAMLRARGLTVVDPRSRMEAADAPLERFFFLYDGHLNVPGHALMAEMIARELVVAELGLEERLQTSLLSR